MDAEEHSEADVLKPARSVQYVGFRTKRLCLPSKIYRLLSAVFALEEGRSIKNDSAAAVEFSSQNFSPLTMAPDEDRLCCPIH